MVSVILKDSSYSITTIADLEAILSESAHTIWPVWISSDLINTLMNRQISGLGQILKVNNDIIDMWLMNPDYKIILGGRYKKSLGRMESVSHLEMIQDT